MSPQYVPGDKSPNAATRQLDPHVPPFVPPANFTRRRAIEMIAELLVERDTLRNELERERKAASGNIRNLEASIEFLADEV